MSNHEISPFTILVTNDGMGKTEIELQHQLIRTYFILLNENNYLPSVIAFYADGVKLLVEGSPAIDQLKALEEKGVRVIGCVTCLNHFGIADKVQVGITGGMTDIIEAQWRAEKVISI